MSETPVNLRTLAREVLARPPNEESLRHYHTNAVACGQIEEAAAVFEILIGRHPQHQTVTSLYIALCLERGAHERAMPHIEHLLAAGIPTDDLLDAALAVRRRLDAQPSSAARPYLSLCMIIRDEAARLAACLQAVKPLADEIVIVDTGSADRSMDIARAFGARVGTFTWSKDFSAARNIALQMAQGRWILVLDADEAIAAQDFQKLRRLMGEGDNGRTAFSIETRNYSHAANLVGWHANNGHYRTLEAGTGWFGSSKVRLFPRRDDIRFHFPVHEKVEPALKKAGIKILSCDVPVHHYGHLDEKLNRRKALAYYEIGCAKLEQLSGDLPALRELAVQAGQLERWSEAIELWQRMLALKPGFIEAYINIAGARWQLGEYEPALTAARQAVAIDPNLKEARFNEAISLLMLDRVDEATGLLRAIVHVQRDYLPALFMLAAACGIAGRYEEAQKRFDALSQKMVGPVLDLARKDLQTRLIRAGRSKAAEMLLHSQDRRARN
jgi:glycosyltransferase involved in cell wall biosynthesis